jgi:hypothetical protein
MRRSRSQRGDARHQGSATVKFDKANIGWNPGEQSALRLARQKVDTVATCQQFAAKRQRHLLHTTSAKMIDNQS